MNDNNNDCFLDMEVDEHLEHYFPGIKIDD